MGYVELIQKTIDYIDANIQEEITVDKLASIHYIFFSIQLYQATKENLYHLW